MPSSLATQLAKSVSLNAPLLSETARKKHFASSSYLFSTHAKGQIDDLDTIYALASNALAQLKLTYPSVSHFVDQSQVCQLLFSQRARDTDRTLLSSEEARRFNDAIAFCLKALGPCLMEGTTGRVLEWLVRRFRVNEFNVPDVLALFLPYHESPHFAKMVSILTIDPSAPWSFLASYKAAGKPVSRTVLATEMTKSGDLARFVVGLLPDALTTVGGINVHRTLISFNVSLLLEYITRIDKKDMDAAVLAFILPALLEPLKTGEGISIALKKDGILSSFVLLAALSHKCVFSASALRTIVASMVHCVSFTAAVDASQTLTALISLLSFQEVLDSLPANVVDELTSLPGFTRALQSSVSWVGVDKVVIPILPRLVDNMSMVEYFVSTERVPESILKHLTRHLIESTLTSNAEDLKLALSSVHQRHPAVLRLCVDNVVEADGSKKNAVNQLLLSISTPSGPARFSDDHVIASTNSDPLLRANAVRHIAEALESRDLGDDEKTTLREALRARIYDTSPAVLDVLYASSAHLLPLFSSPSTLSTLAESLISQAVPRPVLRAHVSFLCNTLYSEHSELGTQILLEVVFPHALFTKPRYKTAASVWDIVSSSRLGKHKLLKGTADVISTVIAKLKSDDKASSSPEEMAKMNAELATRLSENFRASNDYSALLEWLLKGLKSDFDVHKRLFTNLIAHALLASLSGDHQIDAGYRILQVIDSPLINDVVKLEETGIAFDMATFGDVTLRSVVLKPSSRSTLQRLQLGMMAFLSSIRPPPNLQINWFSGEENYANDSKTPASRYLHILQSVYNMINSIASNRRVVLCINRILFENIGAESLLFLAGIWCQSLENKPADIESMKYIALSHALAFLRAQSTELPMDFQAILPALVCTLQSSDKRVRATAMECIVALQGLSSAPKPSAVYAYERVYGPTSTSLQYLDWSDERRYLQMIVDHKEHIVNDHEYLVYFHYEHLSPSKTGDKKHAKLRQRVLCFLLSHVTACPSAVRIPILRSVCRVSDSSKLEMLLPAIEASLSSKASSQDAESTAFETLALGSFDVTAAKALNVDESHSWSVFIRLLKYFQSIGNGTPQWKCICTDLRDGLFASLSGRRQLEICQILIELGSVADDSLGIKTLLGQLIQSPSLISSLLTSLQPVQGQNTERAAKRAKVDTRTEENDPNTPLAKLGLLVEILSTARLPGSFELISTLIETLSRTISTGAPSHAELVYVQQLLMSCIDSSASQIKELPNLAPNAIRLDVLVEVMRISDNPQTFHQSLLLMASLARLSPESVLRNVMPIFTFMGSNVFHRDDTYSFKVIQKTTESIVPVVTTSLKEKHNSRLDLYIGARGFLRTFTDASNHIPRHRRTTFFTHLVDVLVPEDFLAPVVMLLADKQSSRVARQDVQDSQATLSLCLGVLQHYSPSEQIRAVDESLQEVRRLTNIVKDPTSTEKTFLELTSSDDQHASSATSRKRQCQALLILVGHAMKVLPSARLVYESSNGMRDVMATLLEFATIDDDHVNPDHKDIGKTARWGMMQTLGVISTAYFAEIVKSMLASGNVKIQQGALELLIDRVPQMKPEAREAVSSVMSEIIIHIRDIVISARSAVLLEASLEALRSIGASSSSAEEANLTSIVPVVINLLDTRPDVAHSITLLPIIITKLGPRILPFLRQLVGTCVSTLRKVSENADQQLTAGALHALSCLLKIVPTFWGLQELKRISTLYMDGEAASYSTLQLDKLSKLLAKQVPSKTLIPALLQIWPRIEDVSKPNGISTFSRFFDLLKSCLHYSTRTEVMENLRTFFNHFQQSLDVRREVRSDEAVQLEDKVIAAYLELIVQLNETAFQPLFRRTCDWAFGESSSTGRKITFCRMYTALLDLFKELMTPYMSLLLADFVELLETYSKEEVDDRHLWASMIEVLSKSLSADEGAFWRDEKIRSLSDPLIKQIAVCINLRIASGKALLSECIESLIDCMDDDATLRAANLALLKHTKSEDAHVRLFTVQCAVAIWKAHGKKLSAFGMETATFIIECADDENEEIVRECLKLKEAVEAEVGKIDGL